jgi:hypothetical protein
MELYRNRKSNDQKETREVNWRKFVSKSTLPPKLPQEYFTLSPELENARLFGFFRRHNVVVTKRVVDLGDGQFCLDFIWESDYLKVLKRKNELNLIREFANMAQEEFEVTLVHEHRRFSLSKKIGLRVRRS